MSELTLQEQINRVGERVTIVEGVNIKLQIRVCALEEVARAAGAIRQKINVHLQTLNADHWLGPELRWLDAALKQLDEP